MINEKGIDSTFKNMEPGSCLLFYGPSGYGKTYQAERLAKDFHMELRRDIMEVDCECILFIDEIQMIPQKEQSVFLQLIDCPWRYINSPDNGFQTFRFKPIFATTDPDKVTSAIRTRAFKFQFPPYTNEEIEEIILQEVPEVDKYDAREISYRCKLNPREAVHYAQLASKIGLDETFQNFHIDRYGLVDYDRMYLGVLASRQKASLGDIAAALSVSRGTIEQMVEPYLKRMQYISINSSGRELTPEGRMFVKKLWEK